MEAACYNILYICSSTALNVSVGILWISNIIQRNQRRTAICHVKEILDKSVEEVGEIQYTQNPKLKNQII
jgi:hypothetical protein